MNYEPQSYDGTLMFQPKGLLDKREEVSLFWHAVTAFIFIATLVVSYIELTGAMDVGVEFVAAFISNLN